MPTDPPGKNSDLRFRRELRLRASSDFDRIFELRHKTGDARIVVFAAENGLPHPRLGLSVSRRHGNSVVRHRLRRMLKEAFRLEQHALPPGMDYVLIPGREARTAGIDEFRSSLVRLSRKLTPPRK